MTVLTSSNIAGPYAGNDSNTTFDFSFKVFSSADLQVVLTDADDTETTLTLSTDYSVTIAADNLSGTVTYPLSGDPLPATSTLSIIRVVDYTQGAAFQNQGGFYPKTHENSFDKATMQIQQLKEQIDRSPHFSRASGKLNQVLVPAPGHYLSYDADGNLASASGTGADSSLRSDLASNDGASLVGYAPDITGAVAVSVRSKLAERISVKDFGAVGNGVLTKVAFDAATHNGGVASNYPYQITTLASGTDDTVAIQAAFAAAEDNSSIYFPPGVYYVTGTSATDNDSLFELSGKKNIKIYGDGAKIFCYKDITSSSVHLFGFYGCENIVFELDVEMQAVGYPNQVTNGGLTGIKALTFRPLGGAEEFASIGAVVAKTPSKNCVVRNSKFRVSHPDGAYPGAAGVLSGSGKVIGIEFYGDYVDAASLGALPTANLTLTENCSVENCEFTESQGRLVWCWMTKNCNVSNNRFTRKCGGSKPPIRLLHYNTGISISRNFIEGANDWSVKYGSFHEPCINVSHNAGDYVSADVSITDNTVYVEKGIGIALTSCVNGSIHKNTVRTHLGYDQGAYSSTLSLINCDYSFPGSTSNLAGLSITDNNLRNATNGIIVSGADDALLSGNLIQGCGGSGSDGYGIYFRGLDNNVISSNTAVGNSGTGIAIAHNSGWVGGGAVVVKGNYVEGGAVGITYFTGSTNFRMPVLVNNTTKDTAQGYRNSSLAIDNFSIDDTAIANDVTGAVVGELYTGFNMFSTASTVIERGTNGNGTFIKFADGTLVNFGTVTVPTDGTLTARGSLYSSDWVANTFPKAFAASGYSVGYRCLDTNGNYTIPVATSGSDLTTLQTTVMSGSSSITSAQYRYCAVGTWK